MLTLWPFFFPLQLALALMAFSSAIFLYCRTYYLKLEKNEFAYFYIILFLGFGLIFFIESMAKYHSHFG